MHRIQEIDREIMRLQTEKLRLIHPLRQLFWEVTLRCNLECLHCGSDCLKATDTPDMPLDDFLPVLDEIKQRQPGARTVVWLVGGEPLVRPDLDACGRAIADKGFIWGTVTNGMLLDEKRLRALIDSGLRSISIDIDGLEPEHTWLRQNPESHPRALKAARLLARTRHLAWDVITCVNSRNFSTLPQIKEMLIANGVKHWRCFTIAPMGRADGNDELQLTDQQFVQLMDFIVATRAEGRIGLSYACEGYLGEYEGLARANHYICLAGLTVGSVRANGDISGCLSIRSEYTQGNIYRDSFMDVWENRFQQFRDRQWMRAGQCEKCDAWDYCQGNGMHLRRDDGSLMACHLDRIARGSCHLTPNSIETS